MKKLGTPMAVAAGQAFDVAEGPDTPSEGSGDERGDEAGGLGAEAVWFSRRVPVGSGRAESGGVFRGSG